MDKASPISIRIPPDLRAWVEALARRERRSISNQIVYLLEQARQESEGQDAGQSPAPAHAPLDE
jgi:hypothetical protein